MTAIVLVLGEGVVNTETSYAPIESSIAYNAVWPEFENVVEILAQETEVPLEEVSTPRPEPIYAPIPVSEGSRRGTVSHYGTSYNGGPLGCGFSPIFSSYSDARYHSDDPTIAATAWNRESGRAFPCGTIIVISGPAGTIRVQSVDACPGCRDPRYSAVSDIDLSESGFVAVCGSLSAGRCNVEFAVE